MRRHEHKSAINPTPMRETDAPIGHSVWATPPPAPRRRVRIVEEDDEEEADKASPADQHAAVPMDEADDEADEYPDNQL